MFDVICSFIILTANVAAFASCSSNTWGEEEMPEALKKQHED